MVPNTLGRIGPSTKQVKRERCQLQGGSSAKLSVRLRSHSVYPCRALMASIKPFAALRPAPELAHSICELPYDVISSSEAREVAAGNPFSFLHVSKPEIDLPPETALDDPSVYAKGKENFA